MILMPSTAVWYPGWATSLSLEAATFTETESGASLIRSSRRPSFLGFRALERPLQ
jgi:hypothetical protein